jgi:dimeric dUTPase (all-alpha-NTP-PPase superfamily)
MTLTTDAFPTETQLRDLMEALLINQDTLNRKSYDSTWVAKAISGEFDYPLAAAFEIIEFGNSWNQWNWWTKGAISEHDALNMKVELVDALHFILSDILVAYSGNIQTAAMETSMGLLMVQRSLPIFEDQNQERDAIKRLIKDLIGYGSTSGHATQNVSCRALLSLYRLAIYASQLGFRQFAAMYRAKSVLNRFRQDNGYKQKKYTKMWAEGLEDNHVLMGWIAEQPAAPKDEEIYQFLTSKYAYVQAEKARS